MTETEAEPGTETEPGTDPAADLPLPLLADR